MLRWVALVGLVACGSPQAGPVAQPTTPKPPDVPLPTVPLPTEVPETPSCLGFLANGNGALVFTQRTEKMGPAEKSTRSLGFVMVEDRPPPIELALGDLGEDDIEEVWQQAVPRLDAQLAKVGLVPCVEVSNNSGDAWSYDSGDRRVTIQAVWDQPPQNDDEDATNDVGVDGRIRVTVNGRPRDIAAMYAAANEGGDHDALESVLRDPSGRVVAIMLSNEVNGMRSDRVVVARP